MDRYKIDRTKKYHLRRTEKFTVHQKMGDDINLKNRGEWKIKEFKRNSKWRDKKTKSLPIELPIGDGQIKQYLYNESKIIDERKEQDLLNPSKRRKKPIVSYGVVVYHKTDNNEILFYLVQRRYSFSYIDFLRGMITDNGIEQKLSFLTNDERRRLLTYKFDDLWVDLWINSTSRLAKSEYKNAKIRFNYNRLRYFQLLLMEGDVNSLEWGFTKGRKHISEDEIQCALREFEEETGLSRELINIEKIDPFIENYIGTDGKNYRSIYYVASSSLFSPEVKKYPGMIGDGLISDEMGDGKWFSFEEACKILSFERVKIISGLYCHLKKVYKLKHYPVVNSRLPDEIKSASISCEISHPTNENSLEEIG